MILRWSIIHNKYFYLWFLKFFSFAQVRFWLQDLNLKQKMFTISYCYSYFCLTMHINMCEVKVAVAEQ